MKFFFRFFFLITSFLPNFTFGQYYSNIKIVTFNSDTFDNFKNHSFELKEELSKLDNNQIKIIAIRGYKRIGGSDKIDRILPLSNSIINFEKSKLQITSFECVTSQSADNKFKFILPNGFKIYKFNSHITLVIGKNTELLNYIKTKLDLKYLSYQTEKQKNETVYNVLNSHDGQIKSDSTHVEQLKFLSTYIPILMNQYQVDSMRIELQNTKATLDSIMALKNNNIEISFAKGLNLDQKMSLSVDYNFDLNAKFNVYSSKNITYQVGFNAGILKSNVTRSSTEILIIDDLTDKNGDQYQGQYLINNLNENSTFNFIKYGINNRLLIPLSSFNKSNLYINLSAGFLSRLNYFSNITSGSVDITGNYPQYKLIGFNESSYGFGTYNLIGTQFNKISLKNNIPYFEGGVGYNKPLNELLGTTFNNFNLSVQVNYFISSEMRNEKSLLFSKDTPNQINTYNSAVQKLYISNILYSFSLSWNF